MAGAARRCGCGSGTGGTGGGGGHMMAGELIKKATDYSTGETRGVIRTNPGRNLRKRGREIIPTLETERAGRTEPVL